MEQVALSIVTICFNAEDTISRCLESVSQLNQKAVQYIVVDGGSTDATLDILREYEHCIDILVSEADDGIYDAWNKGVRLSKGRFILFLNADDWLPSEAFSEFSLSALDSTKIYIGKTMLFDGDRKVREVDGGFNLDTLHRGFNFLTPSVIFPRQSFSRVGDFDTSYAIAGDVDWLIRAALKSFQFDRLDHVVNMSLGGVSNTRLFRSLEEYNRALRRNGLYGVKARIWALRKFTGLLLRRMVSHL